MIHAVAIRPEQTIFIPEPEKAPTSQANYSKMTGWQAAGKKKSEIPDKRSESHPFDRPKPLLVGQPIARR
jgi:hypothetical protein